MITSYIEEGLHYKLFKRQSMIASYRKEGIHYQGAVHDNIIPSYLYDVITDCPLNS
jgi:hypothetical protein